MKRFVAIIPSRYGSSRFPGKPLAAVKGKIMVQRVYEQALRAVDYAFVATDDKRIADAVTSFGGKVVLTASTHPSGTDRCREALDKIEQQLGLSFDVVLNIQGDEPFIQPDQLQLLMDCFAKEETDIATLIKPVNDPAIITDPNRPKVVVGKFGQAMYFSRSPIPHVRNREKGQWHIHHPFYQHIGLYAYRARVLREITQLEPSLLEKAESLEQLRWLENGFRIQTAVTHYDSLCVDTPEDLEKINASVIH